MIKTKKWLIILILLFSNYSYASDLDKAYKAFDQKDYKTAIYYISYYANLGDATAQYNYAVMLKNGFGTKKDENEAFKWFFLSAEQKNILATYSLGHLYFSGIGTKRNLRLSFNAFLKASLLGHPAAKVNVGNFYFHGHGIKKDFSKAYVWWRLAQDKNINGATQNIEMLKQKISKKDLKKGVDLYRKCLKLNLRECSLIR